MGYFTPEAVGSAGVGNQKSRGEVFSAVRPRKPCLHADKRPTRQAFRVVAPATSTPGMRYYGYRFYNPNIGRWVNRDPIEESGGLHIYRFVENRPIDGVDPVGLRTMLDYITWRFALGICGSFEWVVTFTITPGNSNYRWSWGNVIQEIRAVWHIGQCNKDGTKGLPGQVRDKHFWEQFPIGRGDSTYSYDYWGPGDYDMDGGSGTWGEMWVRGTAAYYYRFAYDPDDAVGDNEYPFPPPGAPSSTGVARALHIRWDCCCGDSETELLSITGL